MRDTGKIEAFRLAEVDDVLRRFQIVGTVKAIPSLAASRTDQSDFLPRAQGRGTDTDDFGSLSNFEIERIFSHVGTESGAILSEFRSPVKVF